MNISILISIIGAISAVLVSLVGAIFANQRSISLQIRKSKEGHYISFVEALHNLAAENENSEYMKNYVFARDKLFIIASKNVINKIIAYETEGVGKQNDLHDKFLTELIVSIREDLNLHDNNLPVLNLKTWKKKIFNNQLR